MSSIRISRQFSALTTLHRKEAKAVGKYSCVAGLHVAFLLSHRDFICLRIGIHCVSPAGSVTEAKHKVVAEALNDVHDKNPWYRCFTRHAGSHLHLMAA